MRRATDRLANETFDVLIIGGGITGACVARDASMRDLKVALIERDDFAHATSAHNSKLVHGGLRYLRNFELGLVRESLHERRIWQRIAPHLVHPLPFLVPMFGGDFKARAVLSAGLTLYDLLSFDRSWLDDPAQRLPGHSWLSADEAQKHEPILDEADLKGAFLYYDAQMYSPERLALECLIDADAHGAAIANYVEAGALLLRDGRVEGCSVRDTVQGPAFDIRARVTLVATGPWSDIFLMHALHRPPSHKLLRSKGIHVVVPSMTREFALTVATASEHFFVLPWRGHTLLGTTDTAFTGDPDTVAVSEADIAAFFAFINAHLPAALLRRKDVEYFYAGLRPLVDDGSGSTYGASRRAELVDHSKDDGVGGLFSAIGGKWTTSRHLAQTTVDTLIERLDLRPRPCRTAKISLPGGRMRRFGEFRDRLRAEFPQHKGIDHLAQLYGGRLPDMLAVARNRPELLTDAGPTGDIAAQAVFAVREEMALTLDDVVMRRTGIGQLGVPPAETLETVSRLMAGELGWDETRRRNEIAAIAPWYRTSEAA